MAIYHFSAQVIGRSSGRSAVAAAAYRAGAELTDERTGLAHDYSRRRTEIETEIHAPANAPAWVQDRAQLWNQVEKAEKRGDAQVAREINVALPRELNPEQQRDLIKAYVQEQFVSRGMVADVAIHRDDHNPHAHIMLTMREIGPEGFGNKVRAWNDKALLTEWRESWATHANRALERAGDRARIDHRSLEAQGQGARLPQIHVGPHAAAMEKKGIRTDRGDSLRYIKSQNGIVVDLERARAEQAALYEARGRVFDKLVQEQPGAPILDAGRRLISKVDLNMEELRNLVKDGRVTMPALEAAIKNEVERAAYFRQIGGTLDIRTLPEVQAAEKLVGRKLTPEDLRAISAAGTQELHQVRGRMREIHEDKDRLQRAGHMLDYRDKLVEQMKEQEALSAKVKRLMPWSRDEANSRHAYLKDELARTEGNLAMLKVKDRGDHGRQLQVSRQRETTDLPQMTKRVEAVQGAMNVINAALNAIRAAMNRQAGQDRQRDKGKEVERGYDR